MNLLLIGVAFMGGSPTSADSRAEAAAEYRAGLESRDDSARARPHFVRAAEIYESQWANGQRTADTARNMAQARLLAGDLGRAIRDFRRGLGADPHDTGLRRGLQKAREQVAFPLTGDITPAARPREYFSPVDRIGVPLPRLALGVLSLWTIGWLLLGRAWLTCRGGLAILGGAFVLAAILLGAGLLWEHSRARAHWSTPTAVLVTPVELRTGNSDEYPRRIDGKLPAGVEVRFLGERGGWLHVELGDGSAGWVPETATELVN
jgi:hypothetical protein